MQVSQAIHTQSSPRGGSVASLQCICICLFIHRKSISDTYMSHRGQHLNRPWWKSGTLPPCCSSPQGTTHILTSLPSYSKAYIHTHMLPAFVHIPLIPPDALGTTEQMQLQQWAGERWWAVAGLIIETLAVYIEHWVRFNAAVGIMKNVCLFHPVKIHQRKKYM